MLPIIACVNCGPDYNRVRNYFRNSNPVFLDNIGKSNSAIVVAYDSENMEAYPVLKNEFDKSILYVYLSDSSYHDKIHRCFEQLKYVDTPPKNLIILDNFWEKADIIINSIRVIDQEKNNVLTEILAKVVTDILNIDKVVPTFIKMLENKSS
jgi:hypothetical protein